MERGFTCNFNAHYLICMRMMLERDRNLLADTRKELVGKITELLEAHAKTGCPCMERAGDKLKELQENWPK